MDSSFSLIKFFADPSREEPTNIGVILWRTGAPIVRIEPDSFQRVLRDNRHVDRFGLLTLEEQFKKDLEVREAETTKDPSTVIGSLLREKVLVTQPRFVRLADETSEVALGAVERLLDRLVRPPRWPGGGGPPSPRDEVERELRPWLRSGRIARDYVFFKSKSDVPRRVDFFVNGASNLALDTVKLRYVRPDDIQLHADAEAYKVEDIRDANQGVTVVVYAQVADQEEVREPTERALKTLTASGADVVASTETAVRRLLGALS